MIPAQPPLPECADGVLALTSPASIPLDALRAVQLSLLMMREMQHRTANVLNLACLQLEGHARRSATADARASLEEGAAMMRRLTRANELFAVPALGKVGDAASEVREASAGLARAHATLHPGIRFDCRIDDRARFDVAPAGVLPLVINELVTNAIKHAFKGRETGYLLITLAPAAQGRACLSVVDDGPGLTKPLVPTRSGIGIVEALAEAVDGKISIGGANQLGGRVHLIFKPYVALQSGG